MMKKKLLASSLFILTAATVFAYPIYQEKNSHVKPINPLPIVPVEQPVNQAAKIEVVFVLDTTGSMGGLIQAAKEKIWSIASSMASAQSAPEIKMGLVAYRDRGDDYVTRVIDLSSDLDSMYATLMDFQAQGGGDGPESVNQAIYDAVHRISWSQDSNTYKVVFLVGDAPPHMDYPNDVKYPETTKAATKMGIVVNTIQCGANQLTSKKWQQIAQLGSGRYFQVEQGGGALAITTPFDEKLATLSRKLDDTRIYYGTREAKAKQQKKLEATDKLHALGSVASRARRATFNASKSGKANLLGEGELVADVSEGRADLSKIKKDELPASMRAMSPAEQQGLIQKKVEDRKKLEKEISELTQKRAGFIRQKVKERGGAKESLDDKLYSAIREQAEKKGMRYEEEAPAY